MGIYVTTLMTLACLTHLTYDKSIWERDIDEDPSPFPFPVIAPYLVPSSSRFFPSTSLAPLRTPPIPSTEERILCLPGCNCNNKLPSPLPTYSFSGLSSSSQTTQLSPGQHIPWPASSTPSGRNILSLPLLGSLSRNINTEANTSAATTVSIRIPTDMERRHSVAVDFSSSISVSPVI